jgi:hypothetical protein
VPLRGYAEKKKSSCVGTQNSRRVTAWVRRAETGKLRGYAEHQWVQVRTYCSSTRRDSAFGCVPTVGVRGAIVHLGAYCAQRSRRLSAYVRRTAEEYLRVYAGEQNVKCVSTRDR